MKRRLWIVAAVLAVLSGVAIFLAIPRNDYILPALRYRIPKIDHYPLFGRAVVAAGDPQPWPYAPGVADARVPDSAEAAFAALETTAYLVVKDGQIVLEQYWDGYADTLWSNSFSMAKSVVSLLVGCAIDDGYIRSVDQPVADFLPGGWTWRPEAGSRQRAVAEASASVGAGSCVGSSVETLVGSDEDDADAVVASVGAGSPVGSPVETLVGSDEMNATIDTAAVPLRIRDLLTMSAGFRWNESSASLFSPTTQIYYGGDLEAILNRVRFKERPGLYFEYQSGVTQLLAMVLTRAVGRPLADYASEKLWRPLGAEEDAIWSTDGKGVEKAFCCFNSNARDFARIGQLILQHGRWNGVPLVDSAYLRAAVTPADYLLTHDGTGEPLPRRNGFGAGISDPGSRPASVGSENRPEPAAAEPAELATGLAESVGAAESAPRGLADQNHCTYYGYQMWIAELRGHTMPYCRGILGQYIIVIPDENMVVVRLGRARSDARDPRQAYTRDLELWVNTALDLFGE